MTLGFGLLAGCGGTSAPVVTDTSPASTVSTGQESESSCDGINLDLAARADEHDYSEETDNEAVAEAYWTSALIEALPVDPSTDSFRFDRLNQRYVHMFGYDGEGGFTLDHLKSGLPVVSPVDGCVTRIGNPAEGEVVSEIDVISRPVEPVYPGRATCNPCRTRFMINGVVPEVTVGQSVVAGGRIGHTPDEGEGALPSGARVRLYVYADDKHNTLCPTRLLASGIVADAVAKISALVDISVSQGADEGFELYPKEGLCYEYTAVALP